MKIALLYYSGAGNTQYIAKHICKKLEELSHSVVFTEIANKTIDLKEETIDLYVLGFPVYDLLAPKLVQECVENLQNSNKPIAYFCTKAFLSVNALKELSEQSTQKGLRTVATLDLFMPGTDLLAFGTKKDSCFEKLVKSIHSRNINSKMDSFIHQIEKNKILPISKKWYSCLSVFIPQKTKEAFHAQYSKNIPNFRCIKKECTKCMLCVKHCPQNNISYDDQISFGSRCDMCLKCLHHCPTEAIQIGETTVGKARYKKVTVKI